MVRPEVMAEHLAIPKRLWQEEAGTHAPRSKLQSARSPESTSPITTPIRSS